MSYILVTGSEGLIGKWLCLSLENLGWIVQRFDIKFSQDHSNFGDILDINLLQKKLENCIGVVHLAAVSRVVWGEKDPDNCWRTNVLGTQNVIEIAKKSPLKPWIVYASSREVYGQQKKLPVEIDTPCMPMNIYAHSKVAAEQETLQARDSSLLRTAIVRYSSVYGSIDDHADRVVPAFCRAAVLGTSIKIEGSDNTLDFTHVDDVVRGTIAIINELERGNTKLPPLHLTTGIPTTLPRLAELVCELAERKVTFLESSSRSYDVAKFWGSTVKTSDILGWQARISLASGVGNLIQEFKLLLLNTA